MNRRFLLIPAACLLLAALVAFGTVNLLSHPTVTQAVYSGQVATRHGIVQPAFDDQSGKPAFLLLRPYTLPSASPGGWGVIYAILYPRSSRITSLRCLPSTCSSMQVAPTLMVAGYQLEGLYPLGRVTTSFGIFYGGAIKGHDLLLEPPGSGRTSDITWEIKVVLFTPIAVRDGAINRAIRTYAQLQDALGNHEAVGPMTSGQLVTASLVSAASYRHGA